MIYCSSDYHFLHDREFIYKPRGFTSIEEMDNEIIKRHNSIITQEDDVYLLGDLLLGGQQIEKGLQLIAQLNGKLHLVRGNHDSDVRWAVYQELPNVVEQKNAIYLNYRKYHFYLSHFPTLTSNLEKESLKQATLNLYGHTHQKTNFFEDRPYMYHCGVDSHNCYPVLLDDIIKEMEQEVSKCFSLI